MNFPRNVTLLRNKILICSILIFQYHSKYQWKSRSDNSPHIYAVADIAYQDMLHHHEPQNIIFSGETLSGKTTNYNHLLDHLLYLGKVNTLREIGKILSLYLAFD